MRFDTLDKKPALYNILAQAILLAVIVALLIRDGAHRHALAVSLLADLFLAAAIVQLAAALLGQLRYNPYSYNTIYYIGFSLFLCAALVMQVRVTACFVLYPESYGIMEIVRILLRSAMQFLRISAPFILLFSAALCISNVSLIRHEGRRPVNLLGILFSFMLVAGGAVLITAGRAVSGSGDLPGLLIVNLGAAAYLYFECMLAGAAAADVIAAMYEPEPDKDFLIILGCGLRKDGTPSPLLRGRIERALAFSRRQKEETGRDLVFIASGGQGPDEAVPESTAMKRYLMERGVPEEHIVEEDRSSDTMENMRFSGEKIRELDPEGKGKIAFATTNYHVFRAGLCARRVKMRALGMGAPTKWYFWPNAAVREFAGLLTEHRGKQALVLGGMLAIYTVLTVLSLR